MSKKSNKVELFCSNYIYDFRYNTLFSRSIISKQMNLCEVELLYIDYKLGFHDWDLISVVLNSDLSKEACIFDNIDRIFKNIHIDKVNLYYYDDIHYQIYTEVTFKKSNGQLIKKLYEFKPDYIKKGFKNKYGWVVKDIEYNVKKPASIVKRLEKVGLIFDLDIK